MPRLFKIPKTATLASHAVLNLVDNADRPVAVRELAEHLNVSEIYLAEVMKLLVRTGIVKCTLGDSHGFKFNRNRERTSLLDVYDAVEGRAKAPPCFLDAPTCGRHACAFGALLEDIESRLREFLAQTQICVEMD